MSKRLLVVDVAALGWDLVSRFPPPENSFVFQKAEPVFPALTCTAQASTRTASPPSEHGMLANGLYFNDLRQFKLWEQSAGLVAGGRVWDAVRKQGKRVGMLFWQQSLGENVDLLLSPKPIHKHHGGMIQDCYCQPADLYARLTKRIGRPFNLMHYWGPLASRKGSDWIVSATVEIMTSAELAPDILLTYIPHLDYDLQRFGPHSDKAKAALAVVYGHLKSLKQAAETSDFDFLFFGDYAMEPVSLDPVFPNLHLRKQNLFSIRTVNGMAYPDFFSSKAFALVDHQVAFIHIFAPASLSLVITACEKMPGVGQVIRKADFKRAGIDHPRTGDLVLVAEPGSWFAYPWWTSPREAPDYSTHVDIHNKPGYDPCELFFGWPPPGISTNPKRIRGTHGRTGQGMEVAWTSSIPNKMAIKSIESIISQHIT